MSIAYSGEGVPEWLQLICAALLKFHSGRVDALGDFHVASTPDCVCRFLGSFLTDARVTLQFFQRAVSICLLTLRLESSVRGKEFAIC